MHFLGFIIFAVIFAAVGAIFGSIGGAAGAVLGGLFIICAQLGEIMDLLKKSDKIQ